MASIIYIVFCKLCFDVVIPSLAYIFVSTQLHTYIKSYGGGGAYTTTHITCLILLSPLVDGEQFVI